jgi:hypothetical protein
VTVQVESLRARALQIALHSLFLPVSLGVRERFQLDAITGEDGNATVTVQPPAAWRQVLGAEYTDAPAYVMVRTWLLTCQTRTWDSLQTLTILACTT